MVGDTGVNLKLDGCFRIDLAYPQAHVAAPTVMRERAPARVGVTVTAFGLRTPSLDKTGSAGFPLDRLI